jgi:hypothetical protein
VPKPNGKQPESRTEVEVCPRAAGAYLARLRIWGVEVRTVCLTDGLVCVDINLTPDQLRQLGADLIAGAELPRPDPGKMPAPPKTGSKP